MKRLIRFRPLGLAALLLGALAVVPAALAQSIQSAVQSACETQLEQAGADYLAGRFDEVPGLVEACLAARPSRGEKARALSLLARAQLANDDLAAARRTVGELLRAAPGFDPDLLDTPRFQRLVADERRGSGAVQVTSVSKTPESLREAPATVLVVTAQEIERRGYLDLEAVFHDLPGFDISRGNGVAYSNLYQRGYLSSTTDRTLVLVDGVEQNDLTSNVAFLSRQYPLTNIDRIEVIYGPAATMYGANAFVGVINVVLKEPEALVREGRKTGGVLAIADGSRATRSLDTTLAGRTADGGVGWSLTARRFQSDEVDLSQDPDWSYSAASFDRVAAQYPKNLSITDPKRVDAFLAKAPAGSDLYRVTVDPATGARGIVPTDKALALARQLDDAVMTGTLHGHPIGASDLADDRWLSGALTIANLKAGFQLWSQREGDSGWYTDLQHPGAKNGALWSPRQAALSLRYSRDVLADLSVQVTSRYELHDLAPDSTSVALRSYGTGQLGLTDLVAGTKPEWRTTYLYRSSSQLQSELSAVYTPSDRFNLVTGLALRYGSIQGDYTRSTKSPIAAETGTVDNPPLGGNQFTTRDAGLYAQASWRLRQDLKLVAGGRLDNNRVRETGGYGTIFNPRLALLYMPGRAVFKAIYSEAFEDASNFNKYSTTDLRRLPNPGLQPEKVRNAEVSAGWQSGGLSAEAAAYQATYSHVLRLRTVDLEDGTTTTQFQDAGRLLIRGLQADAKLRWRRLDLFAGYTYTQPYDLAPTGEDGNPLLGAGGRPLRRLRLGDIATHQANLGAGSSWRESLTGDLRLAFVGDRPTGKKTTTQTNPYSQIDGYTVLNGTLTWKHAASGVNVQLIVNNLLDTRYYDPGVRQAGRDYAARIPQAGRTVNLRVVLKR
jgi:outer membrane receptor for ferrienterochelin and colicins